MNLDFSNEQKEIQSEARKFLEKEGSLKRNRSVLDDKNSLDKELWEKIVAMGWTGIRIPEEYEGLGLGHLELCVVAEELGRSLAPVPFSSSVYLFTEVVVALAYGIELVVVAAGAGYGQSEEGLAHHVDFIVEAITFVLTEIHRATELFSKEGPGGGEDGFVGARFRMQSRVFQQVACEMFGDQGIVGQIRIERAN